ncbi:MAG: hypothetical protein CVV44_15660 [Spirochaetae bacterium HGW-Spirochaetae-1]|jgi:poly-gamma-glutamate synthesis protein (capsule biosynthesis protein)|nr:MAG: hypothetical protein CVV44_15660 [Spirochaetae bacterium HGW-Spirochaetae-1]
MNRIRLQTIAFIIIMAASSQFFCRASSPNDVTVTFAGDIIMHIPVKNSAFQHNNSADGGNESLNNNGFDFLFEKIRPAMQKSNIVQGNMEFPVSPPFQSRPWIFNSPPHVLGALKNAGFTMVTIANNHILDQSIQGMGDTMTYLRKYGLDFVGAHTGEEESRAGLVREVRGIRIGFLAYTGVLNYGMPVKRKTGYLNWFYDREKIIGDIKAMRGRCDYLVMTVHTGNEYATTPLKRDAELMKEYLETGVDCIVGHHPHVLQPVEKVQTSDGRQCFIFYSIGNFISNQSSQVTLPGAAGALSTRDAVLINLYLNKNDESVAARFSIVPITTINLRNPVTGKRQIQTRLFIDELNEKKSLLTGLSGVQRKQTEKEIADLKKRLRTMRTVLFNNSVLTDIDMQDDSGE